MTQPLPQAARTKATTGPVFRAAASLGSSWTRVVVGEVTAEGIVLLGGVGSVISTGIRLGRPTNPPRVIEDLSRALAAAEEMAGARVGPLPHHMREQIYRHYLSEIRCRDADVPVTLSTESLEMWRSLGDDLGFTPANYVCGCGAGATPRKRSLESNPWRDARAALTWDGEPALPASAWRRRPVFTARPPSPCCITESCTVT